MARPATARRPEAASRKKASSNGKATPPRPWSHGQFYWNEIRTRSPERAMKFYADTIGWRFEPSSTPDGHTYWLAWSGDECVAGLFPLTSQMCEGVPESWMSFLAVDDVDARVAKAVKAGAELVMPIFDVPNVGRIAMLREPSGAGVGWITPVGPQVAEEHGKP
jgi:predicted enzyme related to lactoylglutathione lyase